MVVLQLPVFHKGWYFGWVFGWEKKLQAQPRIRLAWQRVIVLSFLGVLAGTGSEAEASHSSKIV